MIRSNQVSQAHEFGIVDAECVSALVTEEGKMFTIRSLVALITPGLCCHFSPFPPAVCPAC